MDRDVVGFADAVRIDGIAVVIDVLRAFTTQAYAFAAGAQCILLAETAKSALALRERLPNALLIGEVAGLPPPGFDYGNSPVEISAAPLSGRTLIHASTAGTVAALAAARRCEAVYLASLVTASATARALAVHRGRLRFVVSGDHCGWDGDEDRACAELIAARLAGRHFDETAVVDRVHASTPGRFLADPRHPEHVDGDLAACTAVDRFDFALKVSPCEHGFCVRPEQDHAGL